MFLLSFYERDVMFLHWALICTMPVRCCYLNPQVPEGLMLLLSCAGQACWHFWTAKSAQKLVAYLLPSKTGAMLRFGTQTRRFQRLKHGCLFPPICWPSTDLQARPHLLSDSQSFWTLNIYCSSTNAQNSGQKVIVSRFFKMPGAEGFEVVGQTIG